MSFFGDLFGGASNAAQSQEQSALLGLAAAQNAGNTASADINQATANAVQPYNQLFPAALQGVTAYGNLAGLNGAAGTQSAQAQLATMPGYQFSLGQGNAGINAAAAAGGTLNSGNQALALQNFGTGLANQNVGTYTSQLSPYLGMAQNVAGGISGAYQNQGQELANVQMSLAQQEEQALAGYGNAQANGALGTQAAGLGLLGGVLGAGASLGGAYMKYSDERLKENIEPVGELFDGQGVYRYNYKGDPTPQIGLMAQEVLEDHPDAVADIGGFLAVDYLKATDYAAQLGA